MCGKALVHTSYNYVISSHVIYTPPFSSHVISTPSLLLLGKHCFGDSGIGTGFIRRASWDVGALQSIARILDLGNSREN